MYGVGGSRGYRKENLAKRYALVKKPSQILNRQDGGGCPHAPEKKAAAALAGAYGKKT